MTYELHQGDCLAVLPTLAADSIDAIVTDPPYGLSFMNKDWDHGIPGEAFWREAWRVAKPGAMLLAFGGTRTSHRLAVAIEDAGWEIRDTVYWVYGSGFPKSADISKHIDKQAGAVREVVGKYKHPDGANRQNGSGPRYAGQVGEFGYSGSQAITAPATPEAITWQGWGTALKPAVEPIIMARKPLEKGLTVAANVLKWGCGGINVGACRVECNDKTRFPVGYSKANGVAYAQDDYSKTWTSNGDSNPAGRWPANLIHDGSDEVLAGFPVTTASRAANGVKRFGRSAGIMGNVGALRDGRPEGHDDAGGSAARYFYCAKASKRDRDEGLEGWEERAIGHNLSTNACARCGKRVKHNGSGEGCECGDLRETIKLPTASRNHHPTVKPTSLMSYLVTLVTPPGGTVLDPFLGSGSTFKAAVLLGFDCVGIEQDAAYIAIARARIGHAAAQTRQPALLPHLAPRVMEI